jgi:hypothetical protein
MARSEPDAPSATAAYPATSLSFNASHNEERTAELVVPLKSLCRTDSHLPRFVSRHYRSQGVSNNPVVTTPL